MEIIKEAENIYLEDFIDFNKELELPNGSKVKFTKDDLYIYKNNKYRKVKVDVTFDITDFVTYKHDYKTHKDYALFDIHSLCIKLNNNYYGVWLNIDLSQKLKRLLESTYENMVEYTKRGYSYDTGNCYLDKIRQHLLHIFDNKTTTINVQWTTDAFNKEDAKNLFIALVTIFSALIVMVAMSCI